MATFTNTDKSTMTSGTANLDNTGGILLQENGESLLLETTFYVLLDGITRSNYPSASFNQTKSNV